MKTFTSWLAIGFMAAAVLTGTAGGLHHLLTLERPVPVQKLPGIVIRV